MKLFQNEVPEVEDGIIELMAAAREPGQRAKMAVRSNDPAVDPVGACVGVKGSRVQNVIQELRGEKIDIVPWDDDTVTFVCNALQPAEISKVFMDEDAREMEVVVPDDQLSLAIGKKGQNVRLAAKLTGWRLDIMGESDSATRTAQSVFNIMLIPNMNETMAQNIVQSGFGSVKTIAESEVEMLMTIPGYDDPEKSDELRIAAITLIESYEKEGKEMPEAPVVEKDNKPKGNAKMAAEERLKEEMAQLSKSDNEASASNQVAEDSSAATTTAITDTAEKQDDKESQPENLEPVMAKKVEDSQNEEAEVKSET